MTRVSQSNRHAAGWALAHHRAIHVVVGIVGLALALTGAMLLAMAATGHVVQGHAGVLVSGSAFLLAAAPAIAMPFSRRGARWLLSVVLVCFCGGSLWLAFFPPAGATPSSSVKLAVVALPLLLAARLVLAGRRRGA